MRCTGAAEANFAWLLSVPLGGPVNAGVRRLGRHRSEHELKMGKDNSKRIWIEGSLINYQWRNSSRWTLPIAELEVVGEYTDPNGPYVDDFFLVFIARPEHLWYEASFYADGTDEFLKELGRQLGAEIACGLLNSTDYNSRVMWPPEVEGIELFEFVPVESHGMCEKLKHRLIPEYNFALTSKIKGFLKAGEKNGV
jgi:hypothetical protein